MQALPLADPGTPDLRSPPRSLVLGGQTVRLDACLRERAGQSGSSDRATA